VSQQLKATTSEPNEARRKDGLLTTGDMARLSRNTLRTVRFYEESGLLSPVQRTEGGHRLFPAAELSKLLLVTDLRAAGFSLDEIREMLEVKLHSVSGGEAARDVICRIDEQLDSMTARVELLERLVSELRSTRTLLRGCVECKDNENFPHACADCTVMAKPSNLPNAVSVLWGLPR
jgi:DNA-binding transcriptional MerR regulator